MIQYPFRWSYDFSPVAFSHGDGSVFGVFVGHVEERGNMMRISGETIFNFHDDFVDPINMGVEPGGVPYEVNGTWTARFAADVFKDAGQSVYLAPIDQ